MSILVPIALFGCIPAVLLLFCVMRPRQAVIVGYLGAWMFLPVASYPLSGLPDFTKTFAVNAGVLLGIFLFDSNRAAAFRPHWADLPIIACCVGRFCSSITNGLGVYDGASEAAAFLIEWGAPYFAGRLYFTDAASLRALAVAIFVGGLIYVPLCLFELRMSPQLHRWIYGYHQHRFSQAYSFGAIRPMVFMQNFLMVSMWMAGAGAVGLWLWLVGGYRRIFKAPMWAAAAALVLTTALCRSINGWLLLAAGAGAALMTSRRRTRLALVGLAGIPPAYLTLRATQAWSGRGVVELVRNYANEEKALSLEARLQQEDLFSERAWRRPVFGWGGYGRMFPVDWFSGDRLTRGIDSLWICTLGTNGLVGLCSWAALMLAPALMVIWRYPPATWSDPTITAAPALALLVILYTIDCLSNGLFNPVFMLANAGLVSAAAGRRFRRSAPDINEASSIGIRAAPLRSRI